MTSASSRPTSSGLAGGEVGEVVGGEVVGGKPGEVASLRTTMGGGGGENHGEDRADEECRPGGGDGKGDVKGGRDRGRVLPVRLGVDYECEEGEEEEE